MYENSAVSGGNSINQSCPRILKTSEEGETRDYEKSPNLDALSEQEPGKLAEWFAGLPSPGKGKLVGCCWRRQRWCQGRLLSVIGLDWAKSSEWGCPCTFLRGSDWGPKNEESVLPGALRPKAAAVWPPSAQSSVTILGKVADAFANWPGFIHSSYILELVYFKSPLPPYNSQYWSST